MKPVLVLVLAVISYAAQAHGLTAKTDMPLDWGCGLASPASELSPLAARYAVTIESATPSPRQMPGQFQRLTWYFYRNAQQIALLKGSVDEVWYRDAQNRISFERVFHTDERVVDYSTGELATLHVKVDWSALSCFVDPSELAQLKRVSAKGKGRDERWRLSGKVGQDRITVDWLPALKLPQSLTRHTQGGKTVRMELVAAAANPPPNWPQPGAQSAHYLHLDAADFGDMGYDPVVRKSEALDTRLGWRSSHRHD